jgi:hypothetical protein
VKVEIANHEIAMENKEVLFRCLERCRYYQAEKVEIFPVPRRESGFMEWIMLVHHNENRTMTVGAVQRSEAEEVEFHT